jgi:hypothetical protein
MTDIISAKRIKNKERPIDRKGTIKFDPRGMHNNMIM